jgi:hypothetical protein
MLEQAFDMIDPQRAPNALMPSAGTHHKVFDKELATAIEQFR